MNRRAFLTLAAAAASPVSGPLAVRAQPARMRRLGVLMSTAETDPTEAASLAAFKAELARLGWAEGQNLEIAYRWGAGDSERMTASARELVGVAPDVLLVKGAGVAAARQATAGIPIVFVVLSDAIAESYVGSFARPSGNLTGFTSYEGELVGKRLTLLREMSPRVGRVLYIRSRRTGADTLGLFQRLSESARVVDLPVVDGPADNEIEIDRSVEAFAREPGGGLIAAFDAFITVHRAKILDLAARYRLPAIYPLRTFTQSGGLLSYGFDQADQFRQAASYVARILGGEKLASLPVQTPTKFDLLVNLKTAKALGLDIPPMLLARADEVIE